MHIQLQIVSKLLFVNFRGSNSAEGGTYQLADMYRRGPNPLADMDRGVPIRGESKSAVTPGPDHRGTIFAFYINSIKKYNEKEKHGEKHSFSDAKHFTDFNFAEMFY